MKTVHGAAALTLLLACSPESDPVTFELQAHSFKNSEWSAPVNLTAINSSSRDIQPAQSRDGLSLYFASNRPGGVGGQDIWVAQRQCGDCPWETPVNLAMINTASVDGGPSLSDDGHLLFFHSNRPGGRGGNDIYVARRGDPDDDFAWGPPTPLGTEVNTMGQENAPFYQPSADPGVANLYFSRAPGPGSPGDLYQARVTRDGATRGAAVLIAELSDPDANDASAAVRNDAREVFFWSDRASSLGPADLFVSTRRSPHDPWSTPRSVGAPVSSEFDDRTPSLSSDGRTLLFRSDRPGGVGGPDIWMTTRTVSGK